jgi:amino acid transporter
MALILALSGTFVWLAVVSTVVRLLTYMLSVAALPLLERKLETGTQQFQLRGGYMVPVLAFSLCLWLVTFAVVSAWLYTAVFFLLGTVFYLLSGHRKAGNPSLPPAS